MLGNTLDLFRIVLKRLEQDIYMNIGSNTPLNQT